MQVHFFKVNDFDFGNYLNLVWNIAHGLGWDTSLYKDIFGFSFLGDHLVLGAAFIAPFLKVWESPYMFAIIHGLCVGSSFFLLPRLVKHIFTEKFERTDYLVPALLICLFLFVNKVFLAPWRYQTHMGTLFAPFLLAALLALHRRNRLITAVSCFFLLLAQERSSVAVFGVGMYAVLLLERRTLGVCLCLLSSLYFFLAVKVIIPWFQQGSATYIYASQIAPFFEWPQKLHYIVKSLLYFGGLPLLGRRACFAACCALPMVGLNIISSRRPMYHFLHQYSDTISLMLIVASIYGMGMLLRFMEKYGFSVKKFIVVFVIAVTLCGIGNFTITPLGQIVGMLNSSERQEYDALRKELAPFTTMDDAVQVFTHRGLGPQFALRTWRREITPERGRRILSNSLVILSPIVDMWATDYPGIQESVAGNPSLRLVRRSPRLVVYASADIADKILQDSQLR